MDNSGLFLLHYFTGFRKLNDYIGAQQLLNQKFDVVSCQHAKENFEEWKILINLDDEKAQKYVTFFLKL